MTVYDYDEMLIFSDGAVYLDAAHIGYVPFEHGVPADLRKSDLELIELWKAARQIAGGDGRFSVHGSNTDGNRVIISMEFDFDFDITKVRPKKRWYPKASKEQAAIELYRLLDFLRREDVPVGELMPGPFKDRWVLRITIRRRGDLDAAARGVELVREFMRSAIELGPHWVWIEG